MFTVLTLVYPKIYPKVVAEVRLVNVVMPGSCVYLPSLGPPLVSTPLPAPPRIPTG